MYQNHIFNPPPSHVPVLIDRARKSIKTYGVIYRITFLLDFSPAFRMFTYMRLLLLQIYDSKEILAFLPRSNIIENESRIHRQIRNEVFKGWEAWSKFFSCNSKSAFKSFCATTKFNYWKSYNLHFASSCSPLGGVFFCQFEYFLKGNAICTHTGSNVKLFVFLLIYYIMLGIIFQSLPPLFLFHEYPGVL